MNIIFKTIKAFNKLKLLFKIFIIFLILVFAFVVVNNFNINSVYINEGFDNNSILDKNNFFEIKRDQEIYDDFYSEYYDSIFLNKTKNNYEIGEIINLEKKNKYTKILDIGCGTGNHVNLLTNKNYEAIGIDQSKDMIKKAKLKYPNCDFVIKDFFKNDFDYNSFTHILCLGRTIYEISNKEKFFESCYSLLMNNGLLIINLVDNKNFHPYISEKRDNNTLFDSSKYGKIPSSLIVKFNKNMEFLSNYETLNTSSNVNIPTSSFREKFENYKTHSVRKNELNLYIKSIKDIINLAKSCGFDVIKKINMKAIDHESEYLYVFKKNN